MLGNDLSNKAAPLLAFNFENVICEEFHKGFFKTKYTLNFQHVNAINKLYWLDFSILYVTFQIPKHLDKLEKDLDNLGCYYNGTLYVANQESLLFYLRQQKTAAYYDTQKNLIDSLYPFGYLWEERFLSVWNKE